MAGGEGRVLPAVTRNFFFLHEAFPEMYLSVLC